MSLKQIMALCLMPKEHIKDAFNDIRNGRSKFDDIFQLLKKKFVKNWSKAPLQISEITLNDFFESHMEAFADKMTVDKFICKFLNIL